jgi:hypothetical protein
MVPPLKRGYPCIWHDVNCSLSTANTGIVKRAGRFSRSMTPGRPIRDAGRRAELADGETSMTAANDLAVRRALELADVEFIDENGGGAGV